MNSSVRSTARTLGAAVRTLVVATVVLGVGYPLVITGIGQIAFPHQANGSVVRTTSGTVVGSALLAQGFTDAQGQPLPRYFQPRPSASGWDPMRSGGSNLGPENPRLVADIGARQAEVARFNGVAESAVPPDAVTASGSGLDPDISPASAQMQIARVARARGMDEAEVGRIVAEHTSGRLLGFLGESTVNVLELNLALDQRQG